VLLHKRAKLEAILPIAPRLLSDHLDRTAILRLSHKDRAWLDQIRHRELKAAGKTIEPLGIKDRYYEAPARTPSGSGSDRD
jgi:hypothetical protein